MNTWFGVAFSGVWRRLDTEVWGSGWGITGLRPGCILFGGRVSSAVSGNLRFSGIAYTGSL